jgi:hypothetical protein
VEKSFSRIINVEPKKKIVECTCVVDRQITSLSIRQTTFAGKVHLYVLHGKYVSSFCFPPNVFLFVHLEGSHVKKLHMKIAIRLIRNTWWLLEALMYNRGLIQNVITILGLFIYFFKGKRVMMSSCHHVRPSHCVLTYLDFLNVTLGMYYMLLEDRHIPVH